MYFKVFGRISGGKDPSESADAFVWDCLKKGCGFMKKQKQPTTKQPQANVVKEAGFLSTLTGPKKTMVARSGDIPAEQKLGILNMLRDDK